MCGLEALSCFYVHSKWFGHEVANATLREAFKRAASRHPLNWTLHPFINVSLHSSTHSSVHQSVHIFIHSSARVVWLPWKPLSAADPEREGEKNRFSSLFIHSRSTIFHGSDFNSHFHVTMIRCWLRLIGQRASPPELRVGLVFLYSELFYLFSLSSLSLSLSLSSLSLRVSL